MCAFCLDNLIRWIPIRTSFYIGGFLALNDVKGLSCPKLRNGRAGILPHVVTLQRLD